jgi:butyrate kinase
MQWGDEMSIRILVINPGNTSTKIAVYLDEERIFDFAIDHGQEELSRFAHIADQKEYRTQLVTSALERAGVFLMDMDVVMGRGGIGKPLEGGVYRIGEEMLEDVGSGKNGEHAANLGPFIAKELADRVGIPAYVMDPVSVDEMEPVARLSGLKELPRRSLIHALNSRAIARNYAASIGKPYEELRLVVAHLGSGISVTPHLGGRMIDCNNPLESGPMCPDRAGALPAKSLVQLCYSGKYESAGVLIRKINQEGGLFDHLGTKDLREAEKMADSGDSYARLVLEAMAYQIGKEIGAMATVLKGEVDAILITGGMAYSTGLMKEIRERVAFIAPVVIRPGENELESLALGALKAMRGELPIKEYQ